MNIQETLFKIASIFLIAHGMESCVDLYAAIQFMPQKQSIEIPISLYYGKALPILIGVLVWLLAPTLSKVGNKDDNSLSVGASVSVGCFLLGIYFIGTYIPDLVAILLQYKKLSASGPFGSDLAEDKLFRIGVLGAKVGIGIVFTIFAVKMQKIFLAIRRFGA